MTHVLTPRCSARHPTAGRCMFGEGHRVEYHFANDHKWADESDGCAALPGDGPTTAGNGKPVAWIYELAARRERDGTYSDWGGPRLGFRRPHVPKGSIRNLRALYAGEVEAP